MKSQWITTLGLFVSVSSAWSYQIPLKTDGNIFADKPATLVKGTSKLSDFADRTLSLYSVDVNRTDAAEYTTFTADCDAKELHNAEFQGGLRPSLTRGDFYVMNHPEACRNLNFNHIQVNPVDLKAGTLEIRLAQFHYSSMGRYSMRDIYKDIAITHSTTMTATCQHYTSHDLGAWKVDLFSCELPDQSGTIVFRVNGPMGW